MPRPCDSHERRQVYRLMHRIYALLGSGEWRVVYVKILDNPKACKKLGLSTNTVGTVDTNDGIIFVDYRFDVLATVVHECIHVIIEDRFPGDEKADEKETQRLEALMMTHMSRSQAMRLHHLISVCLRYE